MRAYADIFFLVRLKQPLPVQQIERHSISQDSHKLVAYGNQMADRIEHLDVLQRIEHLDTALNIKTRLNQYQNTSKYNNTCMNT